MAAVPAVVPVSVAPPLSSRSLDDRRRCIETLRRRLDTCSSSAEIRQYHSQIVRLGLSDDNDAVGRLIKSLVSGDYERGNTQYALRLLRRLSGPDPFVFNTILRVLSSGEDALLLYSEMLSRGVRPNSFTYPSILSSLAAAGDTAAGHQIHAHVMKLGFHTDVYSENNLIQFFLSCGLPDDARRVFHMMSSPDIVSWTTMISGLSKLGLLDDARALFDKMPERNSVSWNAMIAGCVQGGRFKEAFQLFKRMRSEGIVELDKFVAASMLAACAGLGALEQGRWIHGYIEQSGIELDGKLATTVLDMYCKCGCVDKAYEVFMSLSFKGISFWNCMIGGFAMHGRGSNAIELFKEMEKAGMKPDDITLLNILSACAHAGMVEEGRHYFKYIVEQYNLEPKMEHFGCMVDLLGRAGLLEEAKKVIDEMPMEADAGVLGALLGACKIHGNVALGEQIGGQVIELDPLNSGRYVLLANLFASAGRWNDVADVRRLMNDRMVSKEPGCSTIEMHGVVSEFIAGGKSHPQAKKIYAKVDEMLARIREDGYVPDTAGVPHDINGDEEKERPLYYHSEKLAIAYGLLNTEAGQIIRVSKNLRVCRDCHTASKFISRAFDREIIVRDRYRFHHFKGGECSCKDYW